MSIVLNPSTAVQSGLTLIAALTCVDFIRDIPSAYSNNEIVFNEMIFVKFLLAFVVVMIVLVIMFTCAQPPSTQGGSEDARA